MNRQIKFRIWDKELKIMSYSPENCLNFHGQIKLNDGLFHNVEDTCYILMQSTGLVDTEDKEIYEGDIVEFTSRDNLKYIEQVVYYEYEYQAGGLYVFGGQLEWDNISGYDNRYWFNELDMKGRNTKWNIPRLLGNIYENPELLKAEE